MHAFDWFTLGVLVECLAVQIQRYRERRRAQLHRSPR
jgi:hypothetical protein